MTSFHESMGEYKRQLDKGEIQKAYQGLMAYMMGLRTHFKTKHPNFFVSGSIYYGYMDMTYFSTNPQSVKECKLKIAIVFVHDTFRFEVWLSGYNRQIQAEYWQLIKESGWGNYHLVPTIKGSDSIIENVLVDNPDFRDLDALTAQIERETLIFIEDVEDFLSRY